MSFWESLAPILGAGVGTVVGGPLGGALGGAAGGAIAGNAKQRRQQEIEDQTRALASETARYSPWTKMTPNEIQYAGSGVENVYGGTLAGGLTGHGIGKQFGTEGGLWGKLSKKQAAPNLFTGQSYLDTSSIA